MWICIAPCHEHTSKVLTYGTCSQGISQFYLHTPHSSANGMNHTSSHHHHHHHHHHVCVCVFVWNTVLRWQLWSTSVEFRMCPWSPLWPWTDDDKVVVSLFPLSVCLSVCLHPSVRFRSTSSVVHDAVLHGTLECYFVGHFILECFANVSCLSVAEIVCLLVLGNC